MFVLSYVKANYYDRWNNSVHAQAFGGLIFESREEIYNFTEGGEK